MDWLWDELHDLFDSDDGSLPEIRVDFADRAATVAGYGLLRERTARVVSERPSFWTKPGAVECAIDSVPNAAALVVAGRASPFHIVLGGLESGGHTIPDLGVLVDPDRLALDYRMGHDWGPGELCALFDLLGALATLDPKASLSHDDPEGAARFQDAWRRWSSQARPPLKPLRS